MYWLLMTVEESVANTVHACCQLCLSLIAADSRQEERSVLPSPPHQPYCRPERRTVHAMLAKNMATLEGKATCRLHRMRPPKTGTEENLTGGPIQEGDSCLPT